MKTYTVDLTLSISSMTEESADNKLDAFLSALDLKKNEKVELVTCGELTEGESTAEPADDADEDEDEDWDMAYDDIDWDDEDEDEDKSEEESEDEPEDKSEDEPEDEPTH